MKIEVKDISAKKVKEIDVSDAIFACEVKDHVLHTVVKAYMANRRQGTHATKTKSLVAGTGKKPFKQKGTGGARQGSLRGPHQRGGAIAHGPQPRCYRQKLNKKLRDLAVCMALSDKIAHKRLHILSDFEVDSCDSAQVKKLLNNFAVSKALLADERKDNFLYYSARNFYGVSAVAANEINAEHLLRHEDVFISENALKALNLRLGG